MNALQIKSHSRRSFLKLSALAGGGLVLAYYLKSSGTALGQVAKPEAGTMEGTFAPNAFIRIAPDGSVTIFSARPEIGQGIKTSLPMIVAEEMDVDWKRVTVVSAPLDPAFGQQAAGGSTSTPSSYTPLRRVGATARTMLIQAAAQTWGVPETECYAQDGVVHHRDTGRTLGYGELVAAASKLPVPDEKSVRLKDPNEFKLLGSRVGGVDNPKVVTGQSLFGIDQKVPGMLYAVYVKCPVWGGKVVDANVDRVKTLSGVRDVFVLNRTVPYHDDLAGLVPGVAIVADSTWAAFSARKHLEVKWDLGPNAGTSWAGFADAAKDMARNGTGMKEVRKDGDAAAALKGAAKVVEADYRYAFISHTNLEPQNTTVSITGGEVDVWSPTQNPGDTRRFVAEVLGVPPEKVRVNITRVGGGFGRRLQPDPAMEAAAIAQKAGAPVKLTWSREDDMQHDHFRPGGFHSFQGGLDEKGRLVAWTSKHMFFDGGIGPDHFPGRFVANYRLETGKIANGVPMGPWRAPGSCTYAFVVCGFLDELAHAAGRDPVAFNLELLGDRGMVEGTGQRGQRYNAERMRGVVKLVAEKSGWGQKLPRGRGMGLGYYFSHQGYIAEVAEVTVTQGGDLTVDRVVAAVDVGSQIVNLSGAENQIQGSIIDGLNAAWRQELDIQEGRLVQGNFHEYPMLRIPEAPRKIEIHFNKTNYNPTGLGEPCLPPLAPAVANAVFAATGVRIRELPFSRTDLRWS